MKLCLVVTCERKGPETNWQKVHFKSESGSGEGYCRTASRGSHAVSCGNHSRA